MSPALGSGRRMRRFWDRRAQEDPFYFVDNRLSYGDPDLERFWLDGERGLDHMLDLLGLEVEEKDSIVDIGCGIGRLTRPLASRAARVYALDVSAEMLELARRYNPGLDNVRWILGDGRSLAGIEDRSADGCVSAVVFQHIPDPEPILSYVREMGRVLRVGGWAAFQVSNDPEVHRRARPLARWHAEFASLLRRRPRGQAHPAWLGTAIELDQLQEAAADGGLELERVVGEGTQFCMVGARRVARG